MKKKEMIAPLQHVLSPCHRMLFSVVPMTLSCTFSGRKMNMALEYPSFSPWAMMAGRMFLFVYGLALTFGGTAGRLFLLAYGLALAFSDTRL
jgi:hypothetical protein